MFRLPAGTARASRVQSEAASSDVTALCIANLRNDVGASSPAAAAGSSADARLLLAGVGSQLHAFQLPSGDRCCCTTVMPDAARLHGISWLQEGSAEPGCLQLLAAVHGARHAALLRLSGPAWGGSSSSSSGVGSGSGGIGAGWQVEVVARLPRFQHWTMDAQLSWGGAGHSGGGASSSLLLAVGLSNNSVQALSIHLPSSGGGRASGSIANGGQADAQPHMTPILLADCSDRCLLYSMSLLQRQQGPPQQKSQQQERQQGTQQQHQRQGSQHQQQQRQRGAGGTYWLVAAGTVFLDVLVWATPRAAAGGNAAHEVLPLLRLQGHEGSIHRVRWSPCGRLLASASDDRSLRLWDVPALQPACVSVSGDGVVSSVAGKESSGRGAELGTLQRPRHVLWGHTARLWDCCYGGGGSFLVSASEDCSCRLWCLASGRLLAAVPGHRGRGIWHCTLLEQQPALHPAGGGTSAAAGAAGDAEEQAAALAAARCFLFTSGADGSIKAWRLSDWLPAGVDSGAHAAATASSSSSSSKSMPALCPAAESFRLQGMPPDPASTLVGSSAGYGWAHARQQCGAGSNDADKAVGRDSKAEWVRCLALAPLPPPAARSSAGSSTGGAGQRHAQPGLRHGWRRGTQRLLYVATNRGLLHRVHLPDAELQQEERWVCLARSASARPILALQLLPDPAGESPSGDGADGRSVSGNPDRSAGGIWVATTDLAGTATVLLDQPAAATAAGPAGAALVPHESAAGDAGSRAPGLACCWRWQPYGSRQGPMHVGIWWGIGSRHSSGSAGGGDGSALCCRICFTASDEGHITAWQMPPTPGSSRDAAQQQCIEQQQEQQQPARMAEALLPFASPAACLAATLLPVQLPTGWRAALVAAGDAQGGVTALLLLLPSALLAGQGPAPRGAGPAGRLLVLAAARRVHELTPVRTVQLAPLHAGAAARADGDAAAGAQLARLLADAEVLTAGGDGIVRTLRLPAAAIQAAASAALASAAVPAVDDMVPGNSGTACASAEPPLQPPPRLLGTRQRHCEAVTHIDGLALRPGSCAGRGAGSGVDVGPLLFGHFSTHFSVWDDGAEAEVARVPAGGWRRPCAADVAAGDDLAVCYARDGRLWLHRRRPDSGAPPRVLLPPLHGKEQECLRLLELPASCPQAGPAGLCCITGGEDSLLRQQLLPLHPASAGGSAASPPGAFACSALLAEHAQGTAVKALALLRLPGPGGGTAVGGAAAEWLLLSAGARQVLMAHRLRQAPAPAGERAGANGQRWPPPCLLPLLCDELAVKEPPAQPRRPKPGDKLESDQRYLSMSAFLLDQHHGLQRQRRQSENSTAQPTLPPGSATQAGLDVPPMLRALPLPVFVVAAASDASLELLCADLAGPRRKLGAGRRAQQWRVASALRHHACPVLCTAHCALAVEAAAPPQPGPAGGRAGSASSSARPLRQIVLSGATDGSVAVWDVTAAAAAASVAAAAAATAAAELEAEGEEQPPAELAPVLVLTCLHQSGVNDMAAAPAGNGRLLLLTGGDDQALCLTLLQLSLGPGSGGDSTAAAPACSCSVLLRLCIPNAHSSAVRSLWLEGPTVAAPAEGAACRREAAAAPAAAGALAAAAFSVGLDQQVRCWRLSLQQQQQQQQAAALPATADNGEPGSWGPSIASAADAELSSLPWMGSARYATEGGGDGSDSGGRGSSSGRMCLQAEEAGCVFTQVVEPTFLDVLPAPAEQPPARSAETATVHGYSTERRYRVGVAGRGTEMLTWSVTL